MKALLREISVMAEKCREYEVITVFFGGGTPSLLSTKQVQRIMESLKKNYRFSSDTEISMECNPATASLAKLKAYRECGVNRLSIGLQSAEDEELKRLGRIHSYKQFLQIYQDARRAGFSNINIDLMSALPGQTLQSYENTLQKVLVLQPEHISAYSLIIEEGTPFYEMYGEGHAEEGRIKESAGEPYLLPDEDTERKMYHRTNTLLKKAGYNRYEISNFAKKGYECRHNLTYWTGVDYMGFGIGAASYFQGMRYKNTADTDQYKAFLFNDRQAALMPERVPWHEEVNLLSVEEKMEEFMFLGLRLKKGVAETDFLQRFQQPIDKIYPQVVERLRKEGLLIRRSGYIYLSKKGTDVANYVMAQFLLS